MKNRFEAMRRLIAVLTIMAVPIMAAGCAACRAPVASPCATPPASPCPTPPAPPCPAPVVTACALPVTCTAGVALDGTVIRNGQIVAAGAATASAPRRKATESVRVGAVKDTARAARASAATQVTAPAQSQQVKVLPPIVAPAITSDGAPLATVSDAYTITPGQTYTVLPAPTSAQVVSPVAGTAAGVPAQQPVAGYVRVLGPSTMGLTAEEIANYSKSESYGVPPEPEPVAGQ